MLHNMIKLKAILKKRLMLCQCSSNMFAIIQQKIIMMLYTSCTSESQSSESGLPIARSLAGRDFLQLHLLTACWLVWSVVVHPNQRFWLATPSQHRKQGWACARHGRRCPSHLRSFVSECADDWPALVPLVVFVINRFITAPGPRPRAVGRQL